MMMVREDSAALRLILNSYKKIARIYFLSSITFRASNTLKTESKCLLLSKET